MEFKLLHITNDYSGSTVYKNLFQELDKLKIHQLIYHPIKSHISIGKNRIKFKSSKSKLLYRNILNKNLDRVFYKLKIFKIYNDLLANISIDEITMIHAHTWYSDGGVAYEVYKKFKIPYIIVVRNTDLNLFFKYMFHIRNYGIKILLNASKIIFISPIYKERLLNKIYNNKIINNLNKKSFIIPNGIDNFWIKNSILKKNNLQDEIFQLLYIGKFTKLKNVKRLMDVVLNLKKNNYKINLKLIGGGGFEHKKIVKIANKHPDTFKFLGFINDKEDLKYHYRSSHLFTMPSKNETFGLVYVEALSQGLPIIYTMNEGIYGFYENIGEAVKYDSKENITKGILKIYNNYETYNYDIKQIINNHMWSKIALNYANIYEKTIDKLYKNSE